MTMPPEPPGPPTPPPGGPTPPPAGGFPGGQPVGGQRPGELQNRAIARVIDHIIVGVIMMIAYFVFLAIFATGITTSFGEYFIVWTLTGLVAAAIGLAYFAFLESNRGQTVGKMVMKLRTYGPDGVSNPTMEQALKRNAYVGLYALAIIPCIGWFIMPAAAVYIAVTLNKDVPNHQGWHDRFAGGTQVKQIG